ncbi:MAG TPA: lipid-A-disaccharide synthase [Opitutaceae bacterium]|nr:lipid-A-disaccharide synthase [Opitutaceae bacterium]
MPTEPKSLPFSLPPPEAGRVDLLVIAGEHSGDQHAARAVRELTTLRPGTRACALGGPALQAAGAQLLHDMTGTSTIGFAVFSKLSYYRGIIAAAAKWAAEHKPRAVCFVDSSGLNLRIAETMFAAGTSAKGGGSVKALYYISPQIWASRRGRRFAMAKHLDGLAAIFPFEPGVYADTSLPVEFVGHPFVSEDYHAPVRYDAAGPVLLLPGSRRGAVSRIFPILLEAYRLAETGRDATVLYPSDEIRGVLEAANPPPNVRLVEGGSATVAGSAVLTSTGTMSMHCALAGIPGAVTYKTDLLTYFIGRLLVRVENLGIANLLLKEPMYPEFIQGDAKPAALAAQLADAVKNPERAMKAAQHAAQLRELLAHPPTVTIGNWLAGHLG